MLDNLRYKIAAHLAKKAEVLIKYGNFNDIIKGMKYLKASVAIIPYSEELSDFGKRLRELAEKYTNDEES